MKNRFILWFFKIWGVVCYRFEFLDFLSVGAHDWCLLFGLVDDWQGDMNKPFAVSLTKPESVREVFNGRGFVVYGVGDGVVDDFNRGDFNLCWGVGFDVLFPDGLNQLFCHDEGSVSGFLCGVAWSLFHLVVGGVFGVFIGDGFDGFFVFVAGKEPNQKDKSKFYWYAYNVRMKEE